MNGLYHVYLAGDAEPAGHICTWHKHVGDGIRCSDMDSTGNCVHVQIRVCDCQAADCIACVDERKGVLV